MDHRDNALSLVNASTLRVGTDGSVVDTRPSTDTALFHFYILGHLLPWAQVHQPLEHLEQSA
ncbi:hypothetical protein FTO74_18505 [Granulicella sp. WH15]|uniref:hypothetical protein n=1 Tax=Granulicella sp. WH15 TaxID=2602070 RepID=UPI0013675742|nr:hypothetical protein [Granulicella sp. WH15]QHN05115.1 hypothetical protein FTO74_18505 [Granulicella sp. WH15]